MADEVLMVDHGFLPRLVKLTPYDLQSRHRLAFNSVYTFLTAVFIFAPFELNT